MKTRRRTATANLNLAFAAKQRRQPKSSRPGGVKLAPVPPKIMRTGC